MAVTLNANTSTGFIATSDTSGVLQLQTGGTAAVTVDASQNVGIGTASPNQRLQINNPSAASSLALFTNANTGSTGTDGSYCGIDTTGNMYVWNQENLPMLFGTNNGERMRIDSSGNVGIGTSSPVAKLHSAGGVVSTGAVAAAAANASIIDFSGGVSRVWATGADNSTNGILTFITASANASVYNERARIDSSGNLLVGKTSANFTTQGCFIQKDGTFNSAGPTGVDFLNCYSTSAGAYRFYVTNAGTVNATTNTITAISDVRFKENIRDLDVGLDKIMALKPRLYDWKEGKGADIKNARGFIAQEFEQVFPDLIDEWREPAPEGEEPYKAIRQDLIPVLVKAIQEQQAIITSLTDRITALEGTTP